MRNFFKRLFSTNTPPQPEFGFVKPRTYFGRAGFTPDGHDIGVWVEYNDEEYTATVTIYDREEPGKVYASWTLDANAQYFISREISNGMQRVLPL